MEEAGGEAGTISIAVGKAGRINPWQLTPTHRITVGTRDYNALYADISTSRSVNESIKYVKFNDTNYIVDGHHMAYIAKKLRLDEIPADEVFLPYGNYKTVEDLFYK